MFRTRTSAYGATLYASKCVTCHGPQGDGDRRRQPAQRHVPQRRHRSRPRAFHPSRLAGRHAPRSRWTTREMAGIIAYLRNMNVVRRRGGEDRRRGPRTRDLRRQGRLHRLSPRRRRRIARRAEPRVTSARFSSAGSLQRSLVDPTSQMMPINRPVRAGHQGRHRSSTAAGSTRTPTALQIIDDRERLHSLVKAEPARVHRSRRRRRCRPTKARSPTRRLPTCSPICFR